MLTVVISVLRRFVLWWNMTASIRLIILVSFVSYVLSQAPGDGDPFCVAETLNGVPNVFFTNITYPANERPLMDSRDYVALLDGDNPPWQQVDNDNHNDNYFATHWADFVSVSCEVTVCVCGFGIGTQENWLITQHISRVLAGGQRLQKVTARFHFTLNGCDITRECRQSFDVYKWQTSTPNRTAARNTDNYEKVGRVFPDDTSGTVKTNQSLDIELNAESGFYLAVVDLSTCIVIRHILVFYYVCAGETSDLITRPETIDVGTTVTGECVENSSPDGGPNPLVRCGDEGQWEIILPCRCNPGYERDDSQGTSQCSACAEGTYSEGNDIPCQPCPGNSTATQTEQLECPCVPGYYRAPNEGPSVICTQSPSAPLNVSVSNVTNTSVLLSWLPPEDGGGRNLSEIFYTITASETNGAGVTVVLTEVTGTETTVMSLTPAINYTFLVTAENNVSFQDTNVAVRSANVTTATEEGVAGTVSEITKPSGHSTVVSWSPPVPPNGVILYYNIRISYLYSDVLIDTLEVKNTIIDTANYVRINGIYGVEIQAVTSVGAGEFSSKVAVAIYNSCNCESSSSTNIGLVICLAVLDLLFGAVTAILLTCILLSRRKKTTRKHLSSVDYEIPEVYASITPTIHLQHNTAYGKVSLQLTEN